LVVVVVGVVVMVVVVVVVVPLYHLELVRRNGREPLERRARELYARTPGCRRRTWWEVVHTPAQSEACA
jgi:hypothetical protein